MTRIQLRNGDVCELEVDASAVPANPALPTSLEPDPSDRAVPVAASDLREDGS